MNTKYSIKKVWYYLLCMIMTLQLIACTEETHESYTAAPEVEDIYIDQLEELINKMKDLQKNSEYGEKKGQYPTESRAILTDAIDDANRSVLLITYQNPVPSEQEKQRYVASAKSAIDKFKVTIRTEDAETTPAELFVAVSYTHLDVYKRQISADYYESFTRFTKMVDLTDGVSYMKAANEALRNDGLATKFTDSQIQNTIVGKDQYL